MNGIVKWDVVDPDDGGESQSRRIVTCTALTRLRVGQREQKHPLRKRMHD